MPPPPPPTLLNFATHGAQRFGGAVAADLATLSAALDHLPGGMAGVRISHIDRLRPFVMQGGPVGAIAASVLGSASRPVRAILFDKTAETNWSLGWHQDRTICVTRRIEVDGFGPWTVKHGLQHVTPPFDLLDRMITLRVHLDPVGAANAPLLIAPGSHALGLVPVRDIDPVVQRCGSFACLADAGDVWLYATPIVHASRAASEPNRRRVLQVDYAAEPLPAGLEWLGL